MQLVGDVQEVILLHRGEDHHIVGRYNAGLLVVVEYPVFIGSHCNIYGHAYGDVIAFGQIECVRGKGILTHARSSVDGGENDKNL